MEEKLWASAGSFGGGGAPPHPAAGSLNKVFVFRLIPGIIRKLLAF